jgi:hypothetical protein
MRTIVPVVTVEDLYVGMQVHIVGYDHKPRRAIITRVHHVDCQRFPLGKFPKNSRPGGCDFAHSDGTVHSSLRVFSEDGEPLDPACRTGHCIHIRYRNNAKSVVLLWSVRPINPLQQLAEQAK